MSSLHDNPFLLASGNPIDPAFPVQRSVRLRSNVSGYFNRTFSTPTSQNVWTYSAWIKLSSNAADNVLFQAGSSSYEQCYVSSGKLYYIAASVGGTNNLTKASTPLFRDPASWYHFVIQKNASANSGVGCIRIWVNNQEITAWTTNGYTGTQASVPNSINVASTSHTIGSSFSQFDGCLTEVNFIDGQALTPSSFGGYNSGTSVWEPRKYSSAYGNNGFYLNFQDNSGSTATTIGKDSSGNSNNWTPNNISVTAGITYDSMIDVPTNTSITNANYAVLNPLFNTGILGYLPLANGNLSALESSGSAAWRSRWSTIAMPSGSWYAEFTLTYTGGTPITNGTVAIGLHDGGSATYAGQTSTTYSYFSNGNKYNNATPTSFGASYANGDIISIAYDATNGKVWFGKNGTWQASGDPAAGTNAAYTSVPANLFFACSAYWNSPDGNATLNANFGQRPFSYSPPTGFKRLNTFNLPDPAIPNAAAQFAATTYTGTGASQSISNAVNSVSFQPDFIWFKSRSSAASHALFDSVRGRASGLTSNATDAQQLSVNAGDNLVSFNSNGFTIGSMATTPFWNSVNGNTLSLVGWQWKAGGTAVTNTAGSITSSVSANQKAGFSIITYTGTGSVATIGHGLGVAPKLIIVKQRNSANSWGVYHASRGAGVWFAMETTNAQMTNSALWNNTSPTSSVFTVGVAAVSNASAGTHVGYCFSEIEGYSKFGSYTGNGSADGTFVYLGFRPRLVMTKRTDSASQWYLMDTARDLYNCTANILFPNLANAESSNTGLIDQLSNGFKLRSTNTDANASGGTYIYIAFAENPFNYSLAR
jgi:hypothetical protein